VLARQGAKEVPYKKCNLYGVSQDNLILSFSSISQIFTFVDNLAKKEKKLVLQGLGARDENPRLFLAAGLIHPSTNLNAQFKAGVLPQIANMIMIKIHSGEPKTYHSFSRCTCFWGIGITATNCRLTPDGVIPATAKCPSKSCRHTEMQRIRLSILSPVSRNSTNQASHHFSLQACGLIEPGPALPWFFK